MNKAIIFDRDGTLTKGIAEHPDEVDFYHDAIPFLQQCERLNYKILVATNQGGVSLGYVTPEEIQAVHEKMNSILFEHGISIDKFYVSTFHERGFIPVTGTPHERKPEPGMILKAAEEFQLNMEESWMIGDRFSDVTAGLRAGCKTALLVRGCFAKDHFCKNENSISLPDQIISSLTSLENLI